MFLAKGLEQVSNKFSTIFRIEAMNKYKYDNNVKLYISPDNHQESIQSLYGKPVGGSE